MAGYSIEKVFYEARESARRSRINFNAIIEKYSKEFVDDDVVDVHENQIISDRGFIRKNGTKRFGTSHLKTSKRKEESSVGFISGSESDCSQSQSIRCDIVKEEKFDETNPEIWQDIVESFIEDTGNEPSDAETISSTSSSSSKITDDEGSFSDEEYDGENERCTSPLFFTPVAVKVEPDQQEEEYNPNKDGWYSMSRFNNYNPRDIHQPVGNFIPVHPSPTKVMTHTPEMLFNRGVPVLLSPTKPGFESRASSPSKSLLSVNDMTKTRVPFSTLQLYNSENKTKTFTYNPVKNGCASETSSNDVTIVPTTGTENSSDCYVVLSDSSVNHQQTNPKIPPKNHIDEVSNVNEIVTENQLSPAAQPHHPVTPRRKLKAKKSRIRPPRVRTFSNEDLQMFFRSDDPAIAQKILSPPELLLPTDKKHVETDESCIETISYDLPKTSNVTDQQSKKLSLMAMINQMKSKSKKASDSVKNPSEINDLFQNNVLSPTSHLASLRLESPVDKPRTQNPSKTNTTGSRLLHSYPHSRNQANNDLQRTEPQTPKKNVQRDCNTNNINCQKLQTPYQVHVNNRKSAPPLTSENLRIFNTLNEKSCDLVLSPKRCSSVKSQYKSSVIFVGHERPSSTCPIQRPLQNVHLGSSIDLTKSPRRPSSAQPLLRRFSESTTSSDRNDLMKSQRKSSRKLQMVHPNQENLLLQKRSHPENGTPNQDISSDCPQNINNVDDSVFILEDATTKTHKDIINFEELFQNVSGSNQLKLRSDSSGLHSSRPSYNNQPNTMLQTKKHTSSCSLIDEMLKKNNTTKANLQMSAQKKTNSKESSTNIQSLNASKSARANPTINKTFAVPQSQVPTALSELQTNLNIQINESSVRSVNHFDLDNLCSLRSVSSDSSTVNMHMPTTGVHTVCNRQLLHQTRNSTTVQKPAAKVNPVLSKRRQSKMLDFEESPNPRNNLNSSPPKGRRMNGEVIQGFQNGFVIPQASNIIKPVPGISNSSNSRRRPSKSLVTQPVNSPTESIYDWQSDSNQSHGLLQRPVPKFFGASTLSPQIENVSFGTSTPRKGNLVSNRFCANILNESMSTISSEMPNLDDFQIG